MARIRRPLGTVSPNTIPDTPNGSEKTPVPKTNKKRKFTASTESSTVTPEPVPSSASKKPRTSTTSTQTTTTTTNKISTSSKATSEPSILEVSDMVRTDDSHEAIIQDFISSPVPVYDTCDTIRRKIRAFLSSAHGPPITQAAFLRAIVKATYGSDSEKSIQSATLRSFLEKKGALAGNTSTVYYARVLFL